MLIFSIKNEKMNDEIVRYMSIFCLVSKLNLDRMAFSPITFESIVVKGILRKLTHIYTALCIHNV